MNAAAFLFLSIALVVAVFDWIAVARDNRFLEYIFKPLTMVVLVCAAIAIDPTSGTAQTLLIVGLLLSRSEERRVGKECRSRWSAGHVKKKNKKNNGSECVQ